MKLIDFLVSSGRGGWKWPNGIGNASCNAGSRDVIFHFDYCPPSLSETLIAPHDFDAFDIVTRDQYESALAASKPEWDGEGLPPVGCRVEANFGGEWVEATVAYIDRPEVHGYTVSWKKALVFDCKTTRPFWADEFRPIRSEAEKKKEEAIESMAAVIYYRHGCSAKPLSGWIYEEIAAGKIPHIRID